MGILDFILIGIVVLIAIIGIFRGFIRALVDFLSGFTGLIISILLIKPATMILHNLGLTTVCGKIFSGMSTKIITEEAFQTLAASGNPVTGATIDNAVEMSGIGSQVLKALFGNIFSEASVYATYNDFATVIQEAFGLMLVAVIAFIIILILIRIIIAILLKLFTNKSGEVTHTALDRFLGMLFGIAKSTIWIFLTLALINISANLPSITEPINNLLTNCSSVSQEINAFVTDIMSKVFEMLNIGELL